MLNRQFLRDRTPDILSVVTSYVNLRKAGKNYIGLCPLHSDKTPSFTVDASRQRFKCFGCGSGGDVIDFTMKYHGADFKGALSILGISNGRPYRPDPVEVHKRELLKKYEELKKQYDGHLLDLHRVTVTLLDASRGSGRDDLEMILAEVQRQLEPFDNREEESILMLYKAVCHG